MEKVEEQIEALRKFAGDYPIPWKAICELCGIEEKSIPTFSDQRESAISNHQIQSGKIEQLRRNIECISKLNCCATIHTKEVNDIEASKRMSEYLLYYSEKLKEETEKMLKE